MRIVPTCAALAACAVVGLASPVAHSDDHTELWMKAGVRYRAAGDIHLSLDQHWRTGADGRTLRLMPELGLEWSPWKHFELGAGYRFIRARDDFDHFRSRHRLFVDAMGRWKLSSNWSVRYRARWQSEFREEADQGAVSRYFLRNQLALRGSYSDLLQPFATAEIFNRLDRQNASRITESRFTLGNTFEWGAQAVQIFAGLQVPNSDYDPDAPIVGLEYRFKIK
jgi:hypothetical protein